MDGASTFGIWLKQRRKASDLTQEQLAERVGCAAETIRKIEADARRPSRAIADRLAHVLGVPASDRAALLRWARDKSAGATERVSLEQSSAVGTNAAATPTVPAPSPGPQTLVPLLNTKLYLPRPRADLVARPHLLARLNAGLSGRLTVVAAPAGFGKTTLLAEWLTHIADCRLQIADLDEPKLQSTIYNLQSPKVAWLTLDPGDADPTRFLRYLIAALQTLGSSVGAAALRLIEYGQPPTAVLPLLLNDLDQLPGSGILILDDYHAIDSLAVHELVAFLLDQLPPQLHLVLVSRADPALPLARWRVRRELTELRAAELRFTTDEVATLLRDVLRLPLSADDVAALAARTEGWVAGLQLAAISLHNRPTQEIAPFIAAFTGSHHYVVDYLVDEVLARLPAHLQTFLLQSSILDRMCGPLCDAVTDFRFAILDFRLGDQAIQNPKSQIQNSQAILEQLERTNLFVTPLDGERRWYRYHQLFADVLRGRLMSGAAPVEVQTLHRRASVWLAERGLTEEAVQHALAACDWERAASLIDKHGLVLVLQGQAHTVLDWLSGFPTGFVSRAAYLSLLRGAGLLFVNRLDAADAQLQDVEELHASEPSGQRLATIRGTALVLRADLARFRGDIGRSISLAQQALAILPAAEVLPVTAARVFIASAFLLDGTVTPEREQDLTIALAPARTSGDLSLLVRSLVMLADLQRRQGRLQQARKIYDEVVGVAPDPERLRGLVGGAAYCFGFGYLLREWNQLEAAEQQLTRGRDAAVGSVSTDADSLVDGYIGLAYLQQVRGAPNAALATLDELEQLAHERNFAATLIARHLAARARLSLMQGDLAAAVAWADTCGLRADVDLSYPRESEYLTLARVRIAQGRIDAIGAVLDETHRLLDRWLEAAEAAARRSSVIEILILRALALQVRGDLPGALPALERALTLAAPEGYLRIFLDEGAPMAALLAQSAERRAQSAPIRAYAERLLAAFPDDNRVTRWQGDKISAVHNQTVTLSPLHPINPSLVEPLTARELDVLRLLGAGLSNQAIAQELVVAVGTVKRHIANILSKLQVDSRLAAVARARELGLL
jgi:LuxR family maltose regulon positive regulatory protein